MIDNLSIALTHGLMMLVAIRLIFRKDLDREPMLGEEEAEDTGFGRRA